MFVLGKASKTEIERIKDSVDCLVVLNKEQVKTIFMTVYGAFDEDDYEEYKEEPFIMYATDQNAVTPDNEASVNVSVKGRQPMTDDARSQVQEAIMDVFTAIAENMRIINTFQLETKVTI